jgi:hypothetical protein
MHEKERTIGTLKKRVSRASKQRLQDRPMIQGAGDKQIGIELRNNVQQLVGHVPQWATAERSRASIREVCRSI